MHFKILIFLAPLLLIAEIPWGKDAELVFPKKECPLPCSKPLSIQLIEFHQNVISKADGPRSHFIPSSSQYTKEAMQKYGFFKGWILGCDRLMRENSEEWIYPKIISPEGYLMKYDPIN